mgnify:CR=1 FL=1
MNYVEVELHHRKLRVYASGVVHVKRHNRDEYYLKKDSPNKDGYRRLNLQHEKVQKTYSVHRIVGYAYHGLDIDDPTIPIDHINRVRHDNRVENLRPSTRQQNMFNTNAKGYYWIERAKKWQVQIQFNGKIIYLGLFEKEDEHLASECYQQAKLKYHIMD